jgi:hypothetical protein
MPSLKAWRASPSLFVFLGKLAGAAKEMAMGYRRCVGEEVDAYLFSCEQLPAGRMVQRVGVRVGAGGGAHPARCHGRVAAVSCGAFRSGAVIWADIKLGANWAFVLLMGVSGIIAGTAFMYVFVFALLWRFSFSLAKQSNAP